MKNNWTVGLLHYVTAVNCFCALIID